LAVQKGSGSKGKSAPRKGYPAIKTDGSGARALKTFWAQGEAVFRGKRHFPRRGGKSFYIYDAERQEDEELMKVEPGCQWPQGSRGGAWKAREESMGGGGRKAKRQVRVCTS